MRVLLLIGLLAGPAHAATTAATHEGTWQAGHVLWETEWRAEPATTALTFAVPLPPDSRVAGGTAAPRARLDADGRIVGLALERPVPGGTVRLSVPQALEEDVLWAPLLEGDAPQRIVFEGARFTPDPSLGLEKHIRYWAAPDLASRERQQFERAWKRGGGDRAHTADQAIYLRANGAVADAGLLGRLGPDEAASPVLYAVLGGTLAVLLASAVALYRGLAAAARAEANHAYIHRNFRDDAGP